MDALRASFVSRVDALLGPGTADDTLVSFVLTLPTRRDLEEYLQSLLGDDPAATELVSSFARQRFDLLEKETLAKQGLAVYRKGDDDAADTSFFGGGGGGKGKGKGGKGKGPATAAVAAAPPLAAAASAPAARPRPPPATSLAASHSPSSSSAAAPASAPASARPPASSPVVVPPASVAPLPASAAAAPAIARPVPAAVAPAQLDTSPAAATRRAQKLQLADLNQLRDTVQGGRRKCGCQATRHGLVTNCVACGRIVCEQEGTGPCMTCGDNLQAAQLEKYTRMMRERKKGGPAAARQAEEEISARLKSAQDHKNKLLEYDRTSAKRTRVIDDQTDYFSSENNQWLTDQQRESLRQKEQQLKKLRDSRIRTITLDFDAQTVTEHDEAAEMAERLREIYRDELHDDNSRLPAPARPVVQPTLVAPSSWSERSQRRERARLERVQHGFDEEADVVAADVADASTEAGLCLSMWQPWASLLVHGVKVVEGRGWPTAHRGRLWIASTAAPPEPAALQAVIDDHLRVDQSASTRLPGTYPNGALLGSVDVVDCLSQDEYRRRVPDATKRMSDSPFVFICANPRPLPTTLRVSGDHKLWSLERSTLERALAQLDPK